MQWTVYQYCLHKDGEGRSAHDGFCYVHAGLSRDICIPNHSIKMHSSAAFKGYLDYKGGISEASQQAKQLVRICLTHYFTPLPSTSKELQLEVGEKEMGIKDLQDQILKDGGN